MLDTLEIVRINYLKVSTFLFIFFSMDPNARLILNFLLLLPCNRSLLKQLHSVSIFFVVN